MFYDDHGFPDKIDKDDNHLHNIDGGVILRQRKSPVPQLNFIDSTFCYKFDEALHGAQLARDFDISHLDPTHAKQLISLIKQYWSVFNECRTFTPMYSYQWVIDTENAKQIAVEKIMYSPKEMVMMRKSIAALAKVGHIHQIHDGQWLFTALLAA
jgi:hypothetical protein